MVDRHFGLVASYKAGARAAQLVPSSVAGAGAAALGVGFSLGMRERRAMVERHMRRVLGPRAGRMRVARAVGEAFDSYARYYVESFRLPGLDAATVAAGITTDGYEHVERALNGGHGVILALPHLGGWEWAGRWMADLGHRVTVVVEPIEPPALFEWFAGLREALGMTVVALGPAAGTAVTRALNANEVVCLLSDRDLTGSGPRVRFFDEETTLPAGPATLALRTGAPVLPTAVYFTARRDGHRGVVRPPLPVERTGRLRDDVARITQSLAVELEALIRRAPSQWHLFQPNWPSDPGYPH